MADIPQNAETAAREALAELRKALSRVGITGSTVERMRAVPLAVDALETALALRPTSSPGEVTEAMLDLAHAAYREEIRRRLGMEPSTYGILREGLRAALLSTTQTEG